MKNKYRIEGDSAYVEVFYKGQALEAMVDAADIERLVHGPVRSWYAYFAHKSHYVIGTPLRTQKGERPQPIRMHRYLMSPGPDQEVDHINHNGLDNRRSNLRNVSTAENQFNRAGADAKNQSGVRWASKRKEGGFGAQYQRNGVSKWVGTFRTPEEAHAAVLQDIARSAQPSV